MSKGRTKLSFLYYSLLFTYCQFISRSVFSFLMFVSKNVVRFAPIEAERRKDCGNATHGTTVGIIVGDFLEQTPSQSATFSATSPRFL